MHPVGDKPPNVYWRRRLVVILLLIVLIALVVWGIRAVVGAVGEDVQAATPPPTTPATSAPPATATATGTQSASASESESEEATQTESPSASDCSAESLKVLATSSARSAAPGSAIKVGMTIENAGEENCVVDAGSGNLELVITSGNDQVWSSDDCQGPAENRPTEVEPGAKLSSEVNWNAVRSSEGCPTDVSALKPGTYQLRGKVGSITSEPLTIQLT